MTPPIVVISAPNHLAATIGGDLCGRSGAGIWTKQTPHRTFFHVELFLLWGGGSIYLRPDVEIDFFWTHTEALMWTQREEQAWALVQ